MNKIESFKRMHKNKSLEKLWKELGKIINKVTVKREH